MSTISVVFVAVMVIITGSQSQNDAFAHHPQNASCAINETAQFHCTINRAESATWKRQCHPMVDYETILLSDDRYIISGNSIEGNRYRAHLQITRCRLEDTECNFACAIADGNLSQPAVVTIKESNNTSKSTPATSGTTMTTPAITMTSEDNNNTLTGKPSTKSAKNYLAVAVSTPILLCLSAGLVVTLLVVVMIKIGFRRNRDQDIDGDPESTFTNVEENKSGNEIQHQVLRQRSNKKTDDDDDE